MEIQKDWIIVYDKFPKARLHGLVIARDPELEGPADLRAEHVPLLIAMQVDRNALSSPIFPLALSSILQVFALHEEIHDCKDLEIH